MGKVSELLLENEALKADLAAAREQLAEMRQQDREAIGLLDAVVDLYGALADSVGIYGPMPKAVEDAHRLIRESCLSAAPAGGVLWRGQGVIDGYEDYGRPNTTRYTLISFGDESLEIIGEIGKLGMFVNATLTEAPPKEPEDDDWPRECPRCGAAGGSELGPCPMCKGAGFIDKE